MVAFGRSPRQLRKLPETATSFPEYARKATSYARVGGMRFADAPFVPACGEGRFVR
jgi:hypothetical protein